MRRAVLLTFCLLLAAPAVAAGAGPDSRGDRVVITGPVNVRPGEAVNNVVVFDGPVRVAGDVRNDVVAVDGDVRVTGRVHGDVITVARRAVIAPGARVDGDLVYGNQRPVVAAGATVTGDTTRINNITDPLGFVGFLALWLAVTISALVLGLLMLWLTPGALEATRRAAGEHTLASIGWGLVVFFGLPLLALVAVASLVGAPLGVALALALWPLYAVGYTMSAWLLGRRLLGPPRSRILAFLLGLVLLRGLSLIPFLGGILWFGGTVFGLGAVVVALWDNRRRYTDAPPVAT
jgi:hypothetical protein